MLIKTTKFYSCKENNMNNQTNQSSLNLYNKVYTDTLGGPAYPWRVSAGHKFEAMGAMAFFQSKMNNHHIVREYYKSSRYADQIMVQMTHGDSNLYDLRYRINYNQLEDSMYTKRPDKMLVEFKLITSEALNKHGFENSISNLFKPYQGRSTRSFKFLDNAKVSMRNRDVLHLLVIGMTNTPSNSVVPNSNADVFSQVLCVGYVKVQDTSSSKPNKLKRVVHIFNSFSDYAECVHHAVTPQHLFESLLKKTEGDFTNIFTKQFGLP